MLIEFIKKRQLRQILFSIAMILIVSLVCSILKTWLSYKGVALILLMGVSVLAMTFDLIPVLISATLSALIWNYFFIPPLFTFAIGNTDDILMFSLYFIVAMVNAVLTNKIRKAEQKARDREEKENEVKLYNTLLNSLSHELRTPIATIIGAVDILNINEKKLSVANKKELITEIGKAIARLARQVDNLLNISRLESGMLRPKHTWCDLTEMMHQMLNSLDEVERNRISIHADESLPLVKIDAGILEQIILNIIYNALAYTPEKSKICIYIEVLSGQCKFIIEDYGLGFPEKEIALVFDKFYRLPKSKTGGVGLGLSIVKGFVEALSGKVILENHQGGGARFILNFPVQTSYLRNLKNE